MTQKIFRALLIFLTAISLLSCEKSLKQEIPSYGKPRITAYGFIVAEEAPLLLLSKALPMTISTSRSELILNEATVSYYINGELVEKRKLERSNNDREFQIRDWERIEERSNEVFNNRDHLFYRGKQAPKGGDLVKIVIEAPGIQDAVIEERLPRVPKVLNINISSESRGNRDLFLVARHQELFENLQRPLAEMLNSNQPSPKKLPYSSLSEYVKDSYQTVTFEIERTEGGTDFFAIGVPKHNNYIPGIGLPEGDRYGGKLTEDEIKIISARVTNKFLHHLEEAIFVENSAAFPLTARDIAKQKRESLVKGDRNRQYFLPYLSTSGVETGGKVTVQVTLPEFFPRDDKFLPLEEKRELKVFALNTTLSRLAERGYGLLKPDKEDLVHLTTILGEYKVEYTNVRGGMGQVFMATPFSIPLN